MTVAAVPMMMLAVAAELVLLHGRIWTGDPQRPETDAVAVWHARILAVGAKDVQALAGPSTKVIDLQGRRAMPGFRDSHVHMLDAGLGLSRVALKDAPDLAEFSRRLQDFDKKLPKDRWMLGGDWDHDRALGGKLPSAELIDRLVRDRPVWLTRYDGHMGVANSRALFLAGIRDDTPDPPGGAIDRLPGTRTPSGILRDRAMALMEAAVPEPSEDEIAQGIAAALLELRKNGVVAVDDMAGVPAQTSQRLLRRYQELAQKGELTVRIGFFQPLAEYQKLADLGVEASLGGDFVRIGGVKGFADGSLGSSTAKMFAPFFNEPGSTGIYVTEPQRLRDLVRGADARGLQVAVHAIGDRANAELLDAFAEAEKANGPRDRRFRDEHAQHTRAQDIPRFAQLGVVASMQPYHVVDDGRWAEGRVAREVLATSYAYRSLLDAGAKLAFGSDWPVAPVSALLGIDAAVHRRTLDGKHPDGWFPAQRISVAEAAAAYTRTAAWADHRERDEGTIETGKLADIVVLTRDIFADADLASARVAMTIVGGRLVYSALR
jgi:predicted amidohydrolase YtcJ